MGLGGFQKELEVITADLLHSPAKLLVATWNRKITRAQDRIVPTLLIHRPLHPIVYGKIERDEMDAPLAKEKEQTQLNIQ